jgi:putative membrane protein
VHALTTAAWGLDPLQDQQLGGVIMWVPGGVIVVAALVLTLAGAMGRADSRAAGAPA